MASADALARVSKAAEALAVAEDRRRSAQLALRQTTEEVDAARREERQARVALATELRAEGKNWVEVSEQLGVTPQRARKFGADNGIA